MRFITLAAVLFVVLQRGYVRIRQSHEEFINAGLNGAPSVRVINTLTPAWRVSLEGGALTGSRSSIDIKKGCEGFEVMILLAAVLAACPIPWRARVAGILLGCVMIYLLNILRIVSLYYISFLAPGLFDFAHVTLWQTAIIFSALLYVAWWIRRAGRVATP